MVYLKEQLIFVRRSYLEKLMAQAELRCKERDKDDHSKCNGRYLPDSGCIDEESSWRAEWTGRDRGYGGQRDSGKECDKDD